MSNLPVLDGLGQFNIHDNNAVLNVTGKSQIHLLPRVLRLFWKIG